MRKTLTILLLFISAIGMSQTIRQKPPVDLNTIVVCIDSVSYQSLFSNSFVRDTLFVCRDYSGVTEGESGKHFDGKSATLSFELPAKTGSSSATFGDLALQFKTRKINALDRIKSDITDEHSVRTELTGAVDAKIPHYRALSLDNNPSPERFEIFLLEYQTSFLKLIGFSDADANRELTAGEYNKIKDGIEYPKKFDAITALEIDLSQEEFEYLQKSILDFGGSKDGKILRLGKSDIHCRIVPNVTFRLKAIFISLIDSVADREIAISENIWLTSHERTVEIRFQY